MPKALQRLRVYAWWLGLAAVLACTEEAEKAPKAPPPIPERAQPPASSRVDATSPPEGGSSSPGTGTGQAGLAAVSGAQAGAAGISSAAAGSGGAAGTENAGSGGSAGVMAGAGGASGSLAAGGGGGIAGNAGRGGAGSSGQGGAGGAAECREEFCLDVVTCLWFSPNCGYTGCVNFTCI